MTTHAMRRSAAYRAKPSVAETIHGAHVQSAMRNGARALEAVAAMRNCARAVEAIVAMRNRALTMRNCALGMSNRALGMSVLRTGFVRILRCLVRSMGAAHELAHIETSIVGNLSKTLTRSES